MSTARTWRIIAVALAGAYALPLYFPPATSPTELDGALLARLFPGVPGTWIGLRLLALAAAVVAFTISLGDANRYRPAESDRSHARAPLRPRLLGGALFAALGLFCMALGAASLGRPLQLLFAILLPVPAVLTHFAYRTTLRPRPTRGALAGLVLVVAWALARAVSAHGDARAATPVDTWANFGSFVAAVHADTNLLTERFEPGTSEFVHLLIGAPLLDLAGTDPGSAWLRTLAIAWICLTALAVRALAARMTGEPASLVATAAVLFAPATLWLPLTPAPLAPTTAIGIGLFLFFFLWHQRGSAAGLVALATLGGISLAFGHTTVPGALLGLATAISLVRRWRIVPVTVLATAIVCVAAAALPVLPDAEGLARMRSNYIDRFLPWGLVEPALLGQVTPRVLQNVSATARPAEIAAAALLAPVATPRTALRLWGDVFIEPVSAVGAIIALGALIAGRAHAHRRYLLAFLAIAIAPTLTSSYDRPSLIRGICIPAALALLTAAGFGLVAGTRGRYAWRAALALSLAIAASGTLLFDWTNPRILAQSSVAVAIEACADAPERCTLLDYDQTIDLSWLHVGRMAAEVPRVPIETVRVSDIESRRADNFRSRVILWSPALEHDERISERLCARWPDSSFVLLDDGTRLSQAWAAFQDSSWQPALPAARWREIEPCEADAT